MTDKLKPENKFADQFKTLVLIAREANELSSVCTQLYTRASMIHPADKKLIRQYALGAFILTLELDGDLHAALDEVHEAMRKHQAKHHVREEGDVVQ